jgi:hypothetical protein
MGAWLGWMPAEQEYDQLSLYELEEFNRVIEQRMKGGV